MRGHTLSKHAPLRKHLTPRPTGLWTRAASFATLPHVALPVTPASTMTSRLAHTLLAALAALACMGCAAEREWLLREQMPPRAVQSGDFDATLRRAQAAWADRANRDQLQRAVELYELAVTLDTQDATKEATRLRLITLYTRIARARHLLGRAHLEPVAVGERARARLGQNHDLGARAAERALALIDPGFAAAVAENPIEFRARVRALGEPAAAAMLWYAANLAAWAESHGTPTEQACEGDIRAMLERSAALAPALAQAGALRELAAWRARHARGDNDLDEARAIFTRAIDVSPNLVDNRVLFAIEYAVPAAAEVVFTRQLELASTTDPDLLPDWAPENRLASRRARRLLAQRAQFFAW